MRNTVLILLISAFQVFATGTYAQTKTISLTMNDATISEVLHAIQDQSEFYFLYNSELIDVAKKVDVEIEGEKVDAILTRLFDKNEVDFLIKDRYIVLTPVGGNAELFTEQQRGVSGTVTAESGEPLPGVTVVVKGTTRGTVTNADGEYSLANIPEDATLVFSFVGMRTQEVIIAGKTIINVTMKEETIGLEEVVAVGYGVQLTENVTSSVASVKKEEFVEGNVSDVAQLIKGKVSGLSIVNPSGDPLSGSQITLRGVTTLASGTQPLVLIDGVPGDLNSLSEEDIESIDVLKSGAAAAIYGTRATNGVLLIQTVGVTRDIEPTISVKMSATTERIKKKPDLLTAEEFRELVETGDPFTPSQGDYGANTDWIDEITRTPFSYRFRLRQFIFFNLSKYTKTGGLGAFTIKLDSQH